MKLLFNVPSDLSVGIKRLAPILGYELSDGGITVLANEGERIGVSLDRGTATIYYKKKNQFFRGIGVLVENAKKSNKFDITEDGYFELIGVMLQATGCVPSIDSAKRYIDYLALMGYDMLMLYTENTITLEGRPYFGYFVGRYSDDEIRAIDDYCFEYGIELIPCFECYGHMGGYLKWPEATPIKDTADVLLARCEKTFEFLDELIGKASRLFRSRRIHIGMDEAHSMGTGRFLAEHGYVERNIIFEEYMERLAAICKDHGMTPMMWSDMYFRNNNERRWYYDVNIEIPKETMEKVPENVELVFWHYGEEEGCDDALIKKHLLFNRKTIFASGTWSWSGHFPETEYAFTTVRDSLLACRENGVNEFFSTIWNKGECDIASNLLVLSMSAELCYDKNATREKLKSRFEAVTGADFEAFYDMSLYHNDFSNPTEFEGQYGHHKRFFGKMIFWQDILAGLYDYALYERPMSEFYKRAYERYSASAHSGGRWDYMYKYVALTLRFLAVKSEIGELISPAYKKGDRETLARIKDELLPELYTLAEAVHLANRDAWLRDFKMYGVNRIDTRYGGMKERIKFAISVLDDYLDGRLDKIDELAEERLPYSFFGFDGYAKVVSAGGPC